MKHLWHLCLFWVGLSSVTITSIIYITAYSRVQQPLKFSALDRTVCDITRTNYNNPEDFQGFDNVSGTHDGCFIVPNIVHFIRFGQPEFSFVDAICVLAALKNQRPDKIYFHTDAPNFYGKYWKVVLNTPGVSGVIELKYMQAPKKIYGQRLGVVWKQHAAYIASLLVLMDFGGIYLDNDSYIVRNLNGFRKFELAIGWAPGENIGNQVIVAHKNARFLREWLLTYKGHYKQHKRYYNAGVRPTEVVLSKHPELVHRVSRRFAEYHEIAHMLYLDRSDAWLDHYVIHLFINHMGSMLNMSILLMTTYHEYPVVFDEDNIRLYKVSFRDMVSDVYQFNRTDPIESSIIAYNSKIRDFFDKVYHAPAYPLAFHSNTTG